MNKTSSFKFDWVLKDELAIGNNPKNQDDIDYLRNKGIFSVLNLCSKDEAPFVNNMESLFNCIRVPLPDHKTGRLPSNNELIEAFKKLIELKKIGKVYVHCFASVERSPLVCIGFLMIKKKCDLFTAIEYINKVHPETNPLNKQLEKLDNAIKLFKKEIKVN